MQRALRVLGSLDLASVDLATAKSEESECCQKANRQTLRLRGEERINEDLFIEGGDRKVSGVHYACRVRRGAVAD